MARFQILSLVGGGIRGAYTASLLCELEHKLGRRVAECFDLIAGTSTGGIIAAGLAAGLSAADLKDFYVRYGQRIFSPRPKYQAKGYMRAFFPTVNYIFKKRTGQALDTLLRARYCPEQLEASFVEGFGDRTIGSIDFTRLIVPTVNLSRGTTHVFRTPHLPKGVHDQQVKVKDLLVAATAAPTYFPHKVLDDGNSYADGGLWAANPAILAFCEAMRIRQLCHRTECDPSYDVTDIHLLSIGTGTVHYSLTPPGADAGALYWVRHVADVMGASQVQGVHLPLTFLLGERYRHVNFDMQEQWPLDAAENLDELFAAGVESADKEFDSISDYFFGHTRSRFRPYTSIEQEIVTEFV